MRAWAEAFFYSDVSWAPLGVADVIKDFPKPGTAFLGRFLIKQCEQFKGFGRQSYWLLEKLIQGELGCTQVRLAVVEANPVQGFWEKMGYVVTGEVLPHEGIRVRSVKKLMEKTLRSCASF